MASGPSEDTLLSVSGAAAQDHVEKYYRAMNKDRDALPSFYAPHVTLPDGNQVPTIVFNGTMSHDAVAYRDMVKGFGNISHDVQCYDCQVLNPAYIPDASSSSRATSEGRDATLAVIVSGTVKIGPPKEAEVRGFSESFVLFPNPAYSKNRRIKPAREWLIQSQCFRLVA